MNQADTEHVARALALGLTALLDQGHQITVLREDVDKRDDRIQHLEDALVRMSDRTGELEDARDRVATLEMDLSAVMGERDNLQGSVAELGKNISLLKENEGTLLEARREQNEALKAAQNMILGLKAQLDQKPVAPQVAELEKELRHAEEITQTHGKAVSFLLDTLEYPGGASIPAALNELTFDLVTACGDLEHVAGFRRFEGETIPAFFSRAALSLRDRLRQFTPSPMVEAAEREAETRGKLHAALKDLDEARAKLENSESQRWEDLRQIAEDLSLTDLVQPVYQNPMTLSELKRAVRQTILELQDNLMDCRNLLRAESPSKGPQNQGVGPGDPSRVTPAPVTGLDDSRPSREIDWGPDVGREVLDFPVEVIRDEGPEHVRALLGLLDKYAVCQWCNVNLWDGAKHKPRHSPSCVVTQARLYLEGAQNGR